MDAQGFGSTFASGFNRSASQSGFGQMLRPSPSQLFQQVSTDGASTNGNLNPNLTELGSDDDERRAQMEFEQSMRATNMSFFQTAKSTFMSTADLLGEKEKIDHEAWGAAVSQLAARCEFGAEAEVDTNDLAGKADQIMAGGTMSILRRKGKGAKVDERPKYNYELLSSDIQTLLQVFHEEGVTEQVSSG